MMVLGKGAANGTLTEAEVREVFAAGIEQIGIEGKRILVILPDNTRSGPIPLCFRLLTELMLGRAAQLDMIVALGTHRAMSNAEICRHLGITAQERAEKYGAVGLFNHDWQHNLRLLGTIPAQEIETLSQGYFHDALPVEINARIFDYDHLIVLGPVFPHEVVGYSGGSKYFFPGISGEKVMALTHWLSGMLGVLNVIGHQDTPVRRILHRATELIPVPNWCFSMVVRGHHDLAGLYFGTPQSSQAAAAELSSRVNVRYVDRTYHTVLSMLPELYDEFWTGAKGIYKLAPVVADGGTLILYAPHVRTIAHTHGATIERLGYHVTGYYLHHLDELRDVSPLVMGHAALVAGDGSYENGVESPRIQLVLATGIPEGHCQRVRMGYRDPATIDPQEWMGREQEGILVVPRAGEVLYRVRAQ
jgi:nickel-dependent lactate racemase